MGRSDILRLEIRRKPRKSEKRKLAALVAFLGAIILSALLYAIRLQPMIREVAQSEIESRAYNIIVKCVEEELVKSGEDYDDFVHIERGTDGKISAITTDVQKLNKFKLRVSDTLSDIMLERECETISIPIGNLTGIDFFTGIGPRLKFKIMWVSGVGSDFENSFTEAGINQTRHRIMLNFTINAGMMLAGREKGVDVGTSVCVAETIIVGETPKFFADR